MNIRTRLTLLFVMLVASILLLFSVTIYYLYDQFRAQEFEQRLEEKALTTARLWENENQALSNDLPAMANEQVTIYDEQERILYKSNKQLAPFSLPSGFLRNVLRKHTQTIQSGTLEALGVSHYNRQGDKLIIVASAFDRYGFSKLKRLREILFFGWVLCLAITGISGYLFANDALRPVSEIVAQVNTISATNIHRRLRVGRQRDELAYLARTFNDMLTRLEEAFISQKSFVSHASHELRTPLTVMMGQIEVTLLQTRSQADYQAALDGLLDEVKSMIRLVNGLLELARASADATTLNYQPVRIDELLWQAQSHIIQRKPQYEIDIDFENLPAQEEDLVIVAEESLLQTALQNLMENGCKYSPDERVTVRISFEAGQVHLIISDNGYGIPRADLPHIFEPFFRSSSTMTVSGHGIGLALTRRIVELHHGQIIVESEVGHGTTFRISLPTQQQTPTTRSTTFSSDRERLAGLNH